MIFAAFGEAGFSSPLGRHADPEFARKCGLSLYECGKRVESMVESFPVGDIRRLMIYGTSCSVISFGLPPVFFTADEYDPADYNTLEMCRYINDTYDFDEHHNMMMAFGLGRKLRWRCRRAESGTCSSAAVRQVNGVPWIPRTRHSGWVPRAARANPEGRAFSPHQQSG